jgi:hypothetical protein
MRTQDVMDRVDRVEPPPETRGGRRFPWWVAVLVVLAMVASAGGTYLWQHGQVSDRQASLSAALDQRDQARTQATALGGRVQDLQAQLREATSKGHDQVAKLQKEVEAIAGPALPDGRYPAFLIAVGASQTPPKLVFEEIQFFTGDAADQAAKEDGALPPGEQHIPNDVYLRNENPQWRILPIDPTTEVGLTTYPFGTIDGPGMVTLGRFAKLFDKDRQGIPLFPYWITVKDGTVVAIDEQYMP